MIYLFMLLKTVAWAAAFWFGIQRGLKGMLSSALGITLFLTVADKITILENRAVSAVLLTMLLYALMSFFLFPIAWKVKCPAVALACSVMGTFGAFAVVNFLTSFLTVVFSL